MQQGLLFFKNQKKKKNDQEEMDLSSHSDIMRIESCATKTCLHVIILSFAFYFSFNFLLLFD